MVQTARMLLVKDGRVLCIERHVRGARYFVLPGGHLRPGESPEAAAEREVYEETGLRVHAVHIVRQDIDGLGNHQSIVLGKYHGSDLPHLPSDSEEAHRKTEGFRPHWADLGDLAGQVVYPADLNALIRSATIEQAT